MITFYAFCRTVDDLADETDKPREERKSELLKWKNGIVNGFSSPDIIQSGVEELIDRYEIERDLFIELIKGMDCLLYTSPSPRDKRQSRMPSSA